MELELTYQDMVDSLGAKNGEFRGPLAKVVEDYHTPRPVRMILKPIYRDLKQRHEDYEEELQALMLKHAPDPEDADKINAHPNGTPIWASGKDKQEFTAAHKTMLAEKFTVQGRRLKFPEEFEAGRVMSAGKAENQFNAADEVILHWLLVDDSAAEEAEKVEAVTA